MTAARAARALFASLLVLPLIAAGCFFGRKWEDRAFDRLADWVNR